MMNVKVWKEKVLIPTYPIGEPEKNPVFIEHRVYQGSSGKVYPHPVIESIGDEKIEQEWQAFFLENEYLKIMILPELGGRVQMAFDKVKQRHFVYYNQVIKPALVGLTGPWISGGIEFNWPQHHRPSTYQPVDVDIENNSDGSKTVWCNEVELMFRTKGMAGFTLYPDKSYLEIKVKLYNRTPLPQTFLWWANPAVKVNDHYQSVFPPDVHAVFDHGKRDVSDFPIATGTYYKVDYAPGTDISKYKNIPVPTSYMAVNSNFDFVGGYENDSKGGLLHVANHHVSTGKKQWTWGHDEFGQAWDRNLTDEDGPYIELMCGVYTDNQPDFSWIMPFEERSFEQYFMPYHNLGMVKNATKEALVNLELEKENLIVKVHVTSCFKKMRILVTAGEKMILDKQVDASPAASFETILKVDNQLPIDAYRISALNKNGKELVAYQAQTREDNEIPASAKAARLPEDIKTTEQLYLRGLHLEQYRHATYNPVDYYKEALRREPSDLRNNNAMGLWLLRNGQFKKAVPYFRKAIETLTEKNPNPYDGEPLFNLGLCLKYLGRMEEAFGYFYKATWNAAWQGPAYFSLAQIACCRQDFSQALDLLEKALLRNWHNQKARALKATVLLHLNKKKKAKKWIAKSLKIDAFNMNLWFEKSLTKDKTARKKLKKLMRDHIHNYIEYALDYAAAGLFQEAIILLETGVKRAGNHPIAFYFLGWFAARAGEVGNAHSFFQKARKAKSDRCFPHRLEAIAALQAAINYHPTDAKAPYYLANLLYDKKQYVAAIEKWERSAALDPAFPTVFRNLALAYHNKMKDQKGAVEALEKAFYLDERDARVLMELDQLYKRLNYSHQKRLDFLQQYPALIEKRDDLYLERITLLNQLGKNKASLKKLLARKFHPWEGGEGKVTGQYVYALIALAKKAILKKNYNKACKYLDLIKIYPENLGEGKLYGARENDVLFWKGLAYAGLNQIKKAKLAWKDAAQGKIELSISRYYNDQQPDMIFYQGLALSKLGKKKEADKIFRNLIAYGEVHQDDKMAIDYFAVSLPDLAIWEGDLNQRNYLHCQYLIGLGYLGLKKQDKAKRVFQKILKQDINHKCAGINLKIYRTF